MPESVIQPVGHSEVSTPTSSLAPPGAPPLEWAVRAALVLGGTLAFIVALVAAGMVLRGRPGPGFAEGRPGTWASVAMLLWGAALAARIWWWNGSGVRRWFWAVAAGGLVLLAADDALQFHEQLAVELHHLIRWDLDLLSTQTFDGVLVGLYGIVAAAVAWPRRRELLRLRWFTRSIVAAGCFFVAMVMLDVIDWGGRATEEGAKLMGFACIVCALYGVLLDPEVQPPNQGA